MVDAFEDLRSFSRLSLDQLQHLGRGKCVHEEVGDLLSNLFSRAFGAYFMNENCILCSPCLGFLWSKYLKTDPLGAKTVVLAFMFAAMLRKDGAGWARTGVGGQLPRCLLLRQGRRQ